MWNWILVPGVDFTKGTFYAYTYHCSPGVRFTKVFRTELGHKYILVECSVIALCLPVMSKISRYKLCAINRTMIGMSIKRILVLNLCHVLKPFVKSTPGHCHFYFARRIYLWPSFSNTCACGTFRPFHLFTLF